MDITPEDDADTARHTHSTPLLRGTLVFVGCQVKTANRAAGTLLSSAVYSIRRSHLIMKRDRSELGQLSEMRE